MIPWDTFKTPQDAYEWAKKNRGAISGPIKLTPDGWGILYYSFFTPEVSTAYGVRIP